MNVSYAKYFAAQPYYISIVLIQAIFLIKDGEGNYDL